MDKKFRLNIERCIPISELKIFLGRYKLNDDVNPHTKEDILNELDKVVAGNPQRQKELEELLNQYRSAGRGSMTWGVLSEAMTADDLESKLTEQYGEKFLRVKYDQK